MANTNNADKPQHQKHKKRKQKIVTNNLGKKREEKTRGTTESKAKF
jgi:hypothetical protein